MRATVSLILVVLICSPVILRIWVFLRPLRANKDATGFVGRFRRWSLDHVTGSVLESSTFTRTYGGGSVQGSTYSGFVSGSTHVTTDVHDNIRLKLADGRQRNVELINYNPNVTHGDVISVWNASRGERRFTIAVLNHTTGEQTVNAQDVFRILQPRQLLFVGLYLPFSLLGVVFAAFVGSVGTAFVSWAAIWALYTWGQRRSIRHFRQSGMGPVWKASIAEAQPLLAQ